MFEVLSILQKWFKPIALFTILAGLLSAGVSLLLPDYFESVVVFQPANPGLLDRSLFKKDGTEKPVYMFGTKVDIDRVISIGESSAISGYAIKQYKLYDHYEIDPSGSNAEFKVGKKFQENYTIQKNSQGAVEIRLLDTNPINAADWANDLAHKIDELNRKMIFGMKADQVAILEAEVKNQEQHVKQLNDSLQGMVARKVDTVSIGIVRSFLNTAVEDYKGAKTSYDQNKAIISKDIETVFYFEHAVPAKRKTKPVRSLIVLGCTIFTLILMSFVAIFSEKYKEFQNQQLGS